jgi:hypothetical protein
MRAVIYVLSATANRSNAPDTHSIGLEKSILSSCCKLRDSQKDDRPIWKGEKGKTQKTKEMPNKSNDISNQKDI